MKKTKINLLVSKKDYGKIESSFRSLRVVVLIYTIVLFVFVVTLLILHFRQTLKIQSLIEEQKNTLSALSDQKDKEVKLIYAANKLKSLDRYLLDDANFYPYYDLLTNSLSEGSDSATLSSLNISRTREFSFILSFNNFNQMVSSFRLIESPTFLENFEQLSLTQFSSGEKAGDYQLSFKGKFKKI